MALWRTLVTSKKTFRNTRRTRRLVASVGRSIGSQRVTRPRKKLFKNTRRTRRLVASMGKSGVRSSGRRVTCESFSRRYGVSPLRPAGHPASQREKNFSKHPTHPTPRRQHGQVGRQVVGSSGHFREFFRAPGVSPLRPAGHPASQREKNFSKHPTHPTPRRQPL